MLVFRDTLLVHDSRYFGGKIEVPYQAWIVEVCQGMVWESGGLLFFWGYVPAKFRSRPTHTVCE